MLIYLQSLLCWSSISPNGGVIEYNLGAVRNPSPLLRHAHSGRTPTRDSLID